MTTHPPAQMPTERGNAVENESERDMTGPEQMAARAMNETTDPAGRCADCGGAGVIEVDSADEHRDFQPCRCATGPTAGERPYCPIHWGQFCQCTITPAEPDAGDVEALNRGASSAQSRLLADFVDAVLRDVFQGAKEHLRGQMLDVTAKVSRRHPWPYFEECVETEVATRLVARDAAVRKEAGEQIAQAIEAKYLGPDSGRGYDGSEAPDAHCRNAYDEGLYDAARIARETR